VRLARDFDPGFKAGIKTKKDGVDLLKGGVELLAEYQARLAARDTYGVLVVLQALDAAGKDGTIRHVTSGVNPQVCASRASRSRRHSSSIRTSSALSAAAAVAGRDRYFQPVTLRGGARRSGASRQPAAREASGRDARASRLGAQVWARRYDAIDDWERYLSDNGFRIVKLFLNLSREEQRVRFLRRIDIPDHNWKFSSHDVEERQSWDAYQEAFSEMFSHTSTAWAPWYVIPADRKWLARIAATAVIANALIEIDPHYPRPGADELRDLETAKRRLEAEAPSWAAADPFEARESRGNLSNTDTAVAVTPSGTPAQQEG
jgi:polyphosphate kinase 2 (PPK2 family)